MLQCALGSVQNHVDQCGSAGRGTGTGEYLGGNRSTDNLKRHRKEVREDRSIDRRGEVKRRESERIQQKKDVTALSERRESTLMG